MRILYNNNTLYYYNNATFVKLLMEKKFLKIVTINLYIVIYKN